MYLHIRRAHKRAPDGDVDIVCASNIQLVSDMYWLEDGLTIELNIEYFKKIAIEASPVKSIMFD